MTSPWTSRGLPLPSSCSIHGVLNVCLCSALLSGTLGYYLKPSRYGCTPVALLGRVLALRKMSGSTSYHVAPGHASRHFYRHLLMVAIILSTYLFALGFWAAMYFCCMLDNLQYWLNFPLYFVLYFLCIRTPCPFLPPRGSRTCTLFHHAAMWPCAVNPTWP